MKTFRYIAVRAQQAEANQVLAFAAPPSDILQFAEIERVARDDEGTLRGFQRYQIASHIREIRDYLSRQDALLPNPIVVAFIHGVEVTPRNDGTVEVEIDSTGKPGFIVDGQQRLTALTGLEKPGFQVFVSALVCRDYNELRQQFVLINNTRPLPKALIYELLPTVEGLPERFTARSFAAKVVERLNYDRQSSLKGQIHQHTNPSGVIGDTALQKLIMNSASDGAIRELVNDDNFEDRSMRLLSEFFAAVQDVFKSEWIGMTPKTSRLVHGAGIVALGYVMELLYSRSQAISEEQFKEGLQLLAPKTAWTRGVWTFSNSDLRPWNKIQNTHGDIEVLANYLVRELKVALRRPATLELA